MGNSKYGDISYLSSVLASNPHFRRLGTLMFGPWNIWFRVHPGPGFFKIDLILVRFRSPNTGLVACSGSFFPGLPWILDNPDSLCIRAPVFITHPGFRIPIVVSPFFRTHFDPIPRPLGFPMPFDWCFMWGNLDEWMTFLMPANLHIFIHYAYIDKGHIKRRTGGWPFYNVPLYVVSDPFYKMVQFTALATKNYSRYVYRIFIDLTWLTD